MIVFLGHFIHLFCTRSQIELLKPFSFLFNGASSVYLFFILSGFVLSYKFWLNYSFSSLKYSLITRYFRLLFIVFFSGILAYILSTLQLLHDPFDYSQRNFFPLDISFKKMLIENFTVFFTGRHIDKVFWTMRMEYLGSIFVFLLLLLWHSCSKKIFSSMLLCLIFLFSYFEIFYSYSFLLGIKFIFFFLVGMLGSYCYYSYRDFLFKTISKSYIRYPLMILYLYSFYVFFTNNPLKDQAQSINTNLHTLISFLQFCIIGIFLVIGPLLIQEIKNLLDKPILVFFGKISFAFYAIHSLIFGSLNVLIINNIDKNAIFSTNKNSPLLILVLFAIDLLVCILLSFFITKLDSKWNGFVYRIYCMCNKKQEKH